METEQKKIQLLKSILELELKGIRFNKYYTIDDKIEELEFAHKLGLSQLNKFEMEYKLKQLGKMISIGLETINPEEAKKSPLNPDY